MSTASKFFRASVAAATLGTLISGAALFALPAAADVTGNQVGYTYHQGLANGDGSMLMASDNSTGAAAVTATPDTSSAPAATVDTTGTTNTSVTAEPAAQAVNTTPAAQTVAPQATIAQTQPAAASAATAGTGYSFAEIAGWAALILAALIVLGAIWSYAVQDRSDRVVTTRTRRTTTAY